MPELGPLQLEPQTAVGNDPSLGQFASIRPLSPQLIATLESSIGPRPKTGTGPLKRFRRRARPIEHDFTEPFQPPAVAEIEKFVVVTSGHRSLSRQRFQSALRRLDLTHRKKCAQASCLTAGLTAYEFDRS